MAGIGAGEGAAGLLDQDPGILARRRFLGYLCGVLSSIIAAAIAFPLIRFFIGESFATKGERWLKLGKVDQLGAGEPHLFRASYVDQDGWRQTTRRRAVYAVTFDGINHLVFSNACTHLGCPVQWDDKERLFLCPCHNGGFSIEGQVVKGPPPRPLERLDHKVDNGVLYVRVGAA
jgi:menaquinol-cytochrome c reductase iron-sulfur subunit